jgi:hypothetical protein
MPHQERGTAAMDIIQGPPKAGDEQGDGCLHGVFAPTTVALFITGHRIVLAYFENISHNKEQDSIRPTPHVARAVTGQ